MMDYEDTKDYGFPMTIESSSSEPSPDTPSQVPPTSKKTVVSLPETQPVTFDLLMNWLETSTVESTHTAAEGDNEPADLTILELAQLYRLANRLQIPTLMQQVAASLLAFEIDTPTLDNIVRYINGATTPHSDLRHFLIDAIASCATLEAIHDALVTGWMSQEILEALTMALVRRRDEMQRKLEENGLEGGDVEEELDESAAKEKCGSAASSKKRGAAGDVVEEQEETPAKGKRGSAASAKKRGAAEDAGAPKGKRSKKSTG